MRNPSYRIHRATRHFQLLVMLGVLLTLQARPALAQEHEDEHTGHDHGEEHEDVVRLGAAEMQEFGIIVTEAGPAILEQVLELPGEIQANDSALAHIVPRFSGIVTEVRSQVGDLVSAGEVLAVIESDESLSPYEMKTLISGTVIDKHITLGEAVSREHAAFVVADLSSVWVDITVYQRVLTHVSKGQRVTIVGGHDLPLASGVVSYVAPIVDETTRTALARVVLPNGEGIWRPGTFITAQIVVDRIEVPVAVPRTALQMFEGRDVVFVQTEEGFVPRPVVVGRADANRLEIVSGLTPGELYVSQGGFTLKAELGKESFGGDHDH
ncbi:MAG TPA: efflux RND transporter periplasmic adaptor subunit [Hyphomonas sp.]|nr:efflux RND transporter periplasmic adaptor subunit [Hyphomonas sp.]